MRKFLLRTLAVVVCTLFVTKSLPAEGVSEGQAIKEILLVLVEYQNALKSEDYGTAFSLEPGFVQGLIKGVENYKSSWFAPEAQNLRFLYYSASVKDVKIFTPKRALILLNSEDERMSRNYLYVFQEQGKWKICGIALVLSQVKAELEVVRNAIIEFYKNNGVLPNSLSEIVPEYIAALPVDLFNDKEESFQYINEGDANFKIYSFGPDSKDEHGNLEWNYENGFMSEGDIMLKNH